MRNKKGSEGVIVIVLAIMLVIVSILAAILGMQKQRAPMAANTLKRTQAYYYAEAALYETFNRFRNNTPPYDEWDPIEWADNGNAPATNDTVNSITLIHPNPAIAKPVVHFKTPADDDVYVIIDCYRDGTGKVKVDADYDYTGLSLRAD